LKEFYIEIQKEKKQAPGTWSWPIEASEISFVKFSD
jgi:hypothetical protein